MCTYNRLKMIGEQILVKHRCNHLISLYILVRKFCFMPAFICILVFYLILLVYRIIYKLLKFSIRFNSALPTAVINSNLYIIAATSIDLLKFFLEFSHNTFSPVVIFRIHSCGDHKLIIAHSHRYL